MVRRLAPPREEQRFGGAREAGGNGLSRRAFMERAGAVALGAALAQLPGALDVRGLLPVAQAQSPSVVEDTFNGLVAFSTPGNDDYSRHQGESTARPGGVASGATRVLITNVDRYVRASVLGPFGVSVPASSGVAALINYYAEQANPLASGPFPSQFARLNMAEKADVFRRWESDPQWEDSSMRAVSGVLLGYASFLSWSEAAVYDPARRAPSRRPVGWRNSRYDGPADGRPELKGYYQGRRKVRR
jgi:hypothetical protein